MKLRSVDLEHPEQVPPARKALFSMLSVGLQGGSRFISNWLIGRIAGQLALGGVASATALAFTLNTLWPSSAQGGASKFIARARGKQDPDEVRAVAAHLSRRVLQVTGALAVLAPPIWVLLYGGAWWEGLCVSAILITVASSSFARGVHFGSGHVARSARVDLVASGFGIGFTVLLLLLGVRSIALSLPLSVSLGIYSLLCWPWSGSGRPDRELRSEIDKFITFSSLGSLASAGMLQISQLIARSLGEAAAGEYAPALQLVTPLSLITSALIMVLFPAMAEAQGSGDRDRIRKQTDAVTRAFMAILVPIFGALAIASRPVMALVWGTRFEGAAHLMPVFCLALLLNNLAAPSVASVTSGPHRNMWYSMLLSQAGLVAAIIGWVVLVPPLGVLGVAVGYGIGAALTAVSLFCVAWRMNSQRWFGLSIQILIGVAVIIAASVWRHLSPVDYLIDSLVAAGFALAWLAVFGRRVIGLLRSRRSGGGDKGDPGEGN